MASKAGAIRAGRAYVEAFLDSTLAEKNLKQLQAKFSRFANTLAKVGAGFAVAGLAILAPLAKAVSKASELEETMNKFNVVFADNSKAVKEWGDEFGAQVGRSKQQIADFLASSQDLFVPLGFDASTGEDLSKGITKLAVDVASFNNKLDADVLRDFHAALTGGGETVKKYGVIMNVAGEKAELLNMGIDPANATNAEKVMARYNILLRGTTAAQGDAIRSADSWANTSKALDASISDLAATVGTELLPVLAPYLGKLVELIKSTGEFIEEHPRLVAVAAGIGGLLLLTGGLLATIALAVKAGSFIIGAIAALGITAAGAVSGIAALSAGLVILVAAWQSLSHIYNNFEDIAGVNDIADLNKAMEKSIELNDELAKRRDRQKNQTLDSGSRIEDPSERASFFGDALKQAEKELSGMQAQLEAQEQTVKSLEPTWKSLWQSGRATWKVEKAELIDKQKKLEQQKKTVKELADQAAKATEEQKLIGVRSEEANKGIADIIDKLREAEATVGMDSMEKSIHELKKLGALEYELATARKIAARTAKAQADAEKRLNAQRAHEQMKQDQLQAEDTILAMFRDINESLIDAKGENKALQGAATGERDEALRLEQQQREREKTLAEIRRLGGGDREVDSAAELLKQRDALINKNAELLEGPMENSFTAQSGTFSSLVESMFGNDSGDPLKSIDENTRLTAVNTKKIAKAGPLRFGT